MIAMGRGAARSRSLTPCCCSCKHLDYDRKYLYPYRCLLHKAERFSRDEWLRRAMEVYKCDKYEERSCECSEEQN